MQEKNYSEKIKKIEEYISNIKEKITEKILLIINLLKEEKYNDCYIELLVLKQEIIDTIYIYKNNLITINELLIKEKKKKIYYYLNEYDYKLDRSDRNTFIEEELKDLINIQKKIENFYEYLKNNLSYLESVHYIINNMIKL